MSRRLAALLSLGAALAPLPATAEIVARSDQGFVSHHAIEVKATPEDAWAELLRPADWWSAQHTFSGNAANLSIDALPGGCFCESLPPAREGEPAGGVQHMRVINIDPGKVLRMSGAIGPLQSEATIATLTITLKPTPGGTRIVWDYAVGGFMRYKQDEIAPVVDKVLAEQLLGLGGKLGVTAPPASPSSAQAGR